MLKDSAQKVQDFIASKGLSFVVRHYPSTTRTAAEAAATIGCEESAIVKSLVFQTKEEPPEAILVLVSGTNRVDEKKIMRVLGKKIRKADADFVREVTGFAIGGVAPIGHKTAIKTYIDENLLALDVVWAAAGTPNTVFSFPSSHIVELTSGKVISLKKQ